MFPHLICIVFTFLLLLIYVSSPLYLVPCTVDSAVKQKPTRQRRFARLSESNLATTPKNTGQLLQEWLSASRYDHDHDNVNDSLVVDLSHSHHHRYPHYSPISTHIFFFSNTNHPLPFACICLVQVIGI